MAKNINQALFARPKRRIEKVHGYINDTATTTSTDMVLHTVEDRKTLVRAIINLRVVWLSGAVGYNVVLSRAPGGTVVVNAVTGENLDNDTPNELIAMESGQFLANSVDAQYIQWDIKGMRKLQPGDTLVMSHKANIASGCTITGSYVLIFKE